MSTMAGQSFVHLWFQGDRIAGMSCGHLADDIEFVEPGWPLCGTCRAGDHRARAGRLYCHTPRAKRGGRRRRRQPAPRSAAYSAPTWRPTPGGSRWTAGRQAEEGRFAGSAEQADEAEKGAAALSDPNPRPRSPCWSCYQDAWRERRPSVAGADCAGCAIPVRSGCIVRGPSVGTDGKGVTGWTEQGR